MDKEMHRRREWAISLLTQLDTANQAMAELSAKAEADGQTTLETVQQENEARMEEKRGLLRDRVETLKTCLADMTEATNQLHAFREDPDAQRRWSYPFQLTRKGREANAILRQNRERITALVLQNRLLEEEIRRLSDTVHRDALAKMKENSAQSEWMAALESRKKLLDDLCLLLPAIPETAKCRFDPARPEETRTILENAVER